MCNLLSIDCRLPIIIFMARLKESSRLSLILSLMLSLLTYGVEGWMYALWMNRVVEQNLLSRFSETIRLSILYSVAIAGIVLLIVLFTSPVSLLTVGLNGWLRSDTRAFLSIFIGAFAFAILVQRVDYFARFLVLISAIFLVKLDLQLIGYNRWLGTLILAVLCWFGFTGGILAFYNWQF